MLQEKKKNRVEFWFFLFFGLETASSLTFCKTLGTAQQSNFQANVPF